MHTGLEDRARDFPKLAAYFAARARGGAGLLVSGGIAPNRAGWAKPFAGKLSSTREVARHRLVTEAVHAEGGKICMQILHTGRYAYHPFPVAPSALRAPINRFTPARVVVRRRARPDRRLRELRRAGARGRLRRRRDHGFGRLLHQRVPGAAHQQAHRRVGRLARKPRASGARSRAADARRGGPRLHHHLSHLGTRPGRRRRHRRGSGVAGLADGRRRRHHAEHRHRLARGAHPDHRRHGAAWRLRLGVGAHQGGDAPAGHRHQSLQLRRRMPKRCSPAKRRGPGFDGAAAARGSGPAAQGARRTRVARSTPASPATRAASTACSRTSAPPAW